ncbi:hypothetical protein MCOR27_008628 [Pyricularia oryzae]|uniref:Uncharacterized protein n=1 Tax=Pyricularia oryzae (strain 70-15 / ATCC MYA-4617 / FGSC 8958) TaxID=242507 RepID=G4N6X5_PYRO7|nr:uncharacterized protein MGG_14850 [Pyricularia oryzae 70-15]KAH8843533.1 hypothetical protein MCOR01_004328 [Pyricularia oryzae]EHA50739.1 hypothetical protein MGG_14850 [Pyricularia oryzae 70-15]KAH9431010.1 hypothetical protein MCOR02_008322 [Pyricularia oryzae]KAI6268457.1 hypothetical protein MCOR26_009209 [Pyricularia oryzae]KAI6271867.1 hypothetical protein MCOR27_008628 [Pyricularia oryzae]
MSESNESPLPISGGTPITQESLRSRGLAPLLDEVDLLHSPTARGYSRVIRERFGGGETEARSWSILSTNATPEQRTHLHWIRRYLQIYQCPPPWLRKSSLASLACASYLWP